MFLCAEAQSIPIDIHQDLPKLTAQEIADELNEGMFDESEEKEVLDRKIRKRKSKKSSSHIDSNTPEKSKRSRLMKIVKSAKSNSAQVINSLILFTCEFHVILYSLLNLSLQEHCQKLFDANSLCNTQTYNIELH